LTVVLKISYPTKDGLVFNSLLSKHSRIVLFALAIPAFAGSSAPGIKNFHQVNEHVYRGAQPAGQGFQYLAKIGVKTVIDLREADERSQADESAVAAAGMKYVNVPMTGLTPPTESDITRILGILEDASGGAVFVHCRRGADRTGAVIAAYRIDHDHWDNARALSEAKSDGMGSFQFPRRSYIRDFQPRTIEAKTGAKTTSTTSAMPDAVGVSPQNAVSNSPAR
jgi:tyrosine-protein phosphatase SIW14